jgi:hypothetical protein
MKKHKTFKDLIKDSVIDINSRSETDSIGQKNFRDEMIKLFNDPFMFNKSNKSINYEPKR